MALQKPSLLQQFKDRIDKNIKNGAKTSAELRKGIPSIFTAADGKEYRLENVSRYFRTSTNKKVKTLNPTFLDVEKNKEVTASRANAIKLQTSKSKKVTPWNPKTDVPKGLEGHHIRAVKQYAPFYKGLNPKEARELTQWFVDEGVPLGNVKENIANLSRQVHKGKNDSIHTWMQENNVQVAPDETGKGNFVTIEKGKNKGKLMVKGSPGSGVKAVMPDVSHLPLNARFGVIANYLKYVQGPTDTKLADLRWDEQNKKSAPIPQAELEEIARENKIENKLKKRQSEYPSLDEDLGVGKFKKRSNKVGGKVRTADALARIGTDLSTGNYLGAGATAGTLGAMRLLGNKPMQKAIGGQIARLIGRQGAKTAAKAVPGLDIWLSYKDMQHYLRQGKLDQAGIAALSGAIGWIPVIGDGGAAALDFTNTGLDISRLQVPTTKKKKVIKAKPGFTPTRRLKVNF